MNTARKRLFGLFAIILLILSTTTLCAASEEIRLEELAYVSPQASPTGQEVTVVGSESGSVLLVLKGKSLYRVKLKGIAFPPLGNYDPIRLSISRLLRNTIGKEALIETEKTSNLDGPAYVWLKTEEGTLLLQSLLVSNGFASMAGKEDEYIDLAPAQAFAKDRELGIWDENRDKLLTVSTETLGINVSGIERVDGVQIEDVRILDNGDFGFVTLLVKRDGNLNGVILSIVSSTDRARDEDSITISSQRDMKAGDSFVILIALDRAQTPSFNFDEVWITYLDPRGGFLRLSSPDGKQSLYEYQYSRKVSSYVVTPLN